jgi:putative ABC transport system permease protein
VGVSPAELQAWQTQRDLFEETAWYRYVPQNQNLSVPGSEPLAVRTDFVATNLFSLLGTTPVMGRAFIPAEDPHSALLSDRLWRSHFAGNPSIVGKTIHLNDDQFTVVGVMQSTAQFPEWADLWLPKGPLLGDQLTNPVRHALGFLARLRPGIEEKQATTRLLAISQRLAQEHPKTSTGWGIRVSNLQDDETENIRPALLMLLGAASLLLLIACGNIANLLLSRAAGRTKEIAVRTAVGASAPRIVRQLITESLVLALLGGVLGWVFAKGALIATMPARSNLEPEVVLFLTATVLATGIFFGLAPALVALRTDPQSVIKSASATSSGMTTRATLVVLEFALTLMLVMGAAILAKSFVRLMHVDPGFNSHGILTMRILAPPSRRPEALFHRMQEKLLSLPGVQTIALTNALPLIADRANTSRFNVPGSPLINPDALPAGQLRTASPDYFHAMAIPLRSGRTFTEHELNQAVVVINETLAKRFWPGRNPVGIKFITGPWGPNPSWSTIIGVVGDVKQFGLDSEPSMDLYYPGLAAQYLIVKTTADPLSMANTVERDLHAIDPELAISNIQTMDQVASESTRTRRWTMGLLATFAGLAFVLALVGIYGVMAWSVAHRAREIGIRIAIGAQRNQVLGLILRYGLKLAISGLVLGILGAFALRHVLSGLTYGVSTADPFIYTLAPISMLGVALLACYLPARRAISVDPLVSLRYE